MTPPRPFPTASRCTSAMPDIVRERLFSLQDPAYRDFLSRLIPTVRPETVIGVRTPELRKLARQLSREEEGAAFLRELPHAYFEENQLHAFLISEIRDFAACAEEVNRFLPHVDNWATCDQLSPPVFARHREELLPHIGEWIRSGDTWPVRFGVGMLMRHFLDDAFDPAYPRMVSEIRSDEYYVKMMVAWYFATALAKQYDRVLPYLENRTLDPWTHNKAIQKAKESYRITPEHKACLTRLKIKIPR